MTTDATAALADVLAETGAVPRRQIRRAVQALGEGRTRALLLEALALEAGGGELLPDGSRRRTPGGIFFRLVRGAASPAERAAIFWASEAGTGRPSHGPVAPPFTWDDYGALAPRLRQGAGEATTVKFTVIGRPRQVRAQGEVVIVPLVSEKLSTLPKGLPTPATGTAYAVLIAKKQWQKAAAALQVPEDRLIVEGYPTLDPRFPGITVLATNVTTRNVQMAKRAAQAGQGG
jgi:hypothetical protein